MKKTALVIFGGKSTEYAISLCSAASVIRNFPTDKYNLLTLGITQNGDWLFFDGDADSIENDTWQQGNTCKAILSPDSGDRGLLIFGKDGVQKKHVDVIFPVLHGKNGEDGTIQGLFKLSDIPYAGCGHLSSAITMDKAFTNLIADYYGIPQAKWTAANRYQYTAQKEAVLQQAEEKLGYPIFVKPACAGSSVGVSKATDRKSLEAAIDHAFTIDNKVVLEETVYGKEVECAVLGNDAAVVSVPGEIEPCAEFYDYDAKYISDSKLYIPARIDADAAEKVQKTALQVFHCFDAAGLSRVDFFAGDNGTVYFNEINTIPGFTKISMYAKLFAASGVSYPELIDRILTFAQERHAAK